MSAVPIHARRRMQSVGKKFQITTKALPWRYGRRKGRLFARTSKQREKSSREDNLTLPFFVSDAGLAHLEDLTSLRVLRISGRQISDAGLAHLTGLALLKRLVIYETQISGEGVARFKVALPNCSVINW